MESNKRGICCLPTATVITRESEEEPLSCISERLETALQHNKPLIIIRNLYLGNLMTSWANTGNTLRHASSACAVASMAYCAVSPRRYFPLAPVMAFSSVFIHAVYGLVWTRDRTAAYQVVPAVKTENMEGDVGDCKDVVLVRAGQNLDFSLHGFLSGCALGVCLYLWLQQCPESCDVH